jgi:hypothetical protein
LGTDAVERWRRSGIAGFVLFTGIGLIMFGLFVAFAGSVTMPDFSGNQQKVFPEFFNLGVIMLAAGIVIAIGGLFFVRKTFQGNPPIPVTTLLPAQSPVVTKETMIVKEVVMVPCQYCGVLMPQTSTFCPNCGAQRKA